MTQWIGFGKMVLFAGAVCMESVCMAKQPNVLLLISDDQGFCELGSYLDFADPATMGAKRIDEWRKITECTPEQAPIDVCIEAARKCMPNIDRIAAQGMRFTDFHAAPTCAPSRTALMAARYPQRFGIYCNDEFEAASAKAVPLDVDLPVRLFHEAGYLTGLSGKWHLGHEPGQWPQERGFDWFFGFDRAHTEKYGSKILQRNGQSVPANGWLADQITDEAVDFLKLADQEDKPFFLYVAYNEPHGPTPRPPQKYIDHFKSGSDNVDVHFATLYGMDCGIGRIFAQLEKTGRLDNTLILYGSDNGQAQGPYHHGFRIREEAYLVPVPGNGPLQGCKWTPWEGGVRTVFVAKLPGGAKGTSDVLLSVLDVMPTALDYAGIAVPDSMKLDGQSFLPLLQGKKGDVDRTLFWASDSQEPFGNFGPDDDALLKTFQQAGETKIRSEKYPPAWYVRTEKWKLMGWDTIAPVLIDMENDIGERHDLAAQFPEVVGQLSGQFQSWLEQQAPPQVYPRKQWSKLFADHDAGEPKEETGKPAGLAGGDVLVQWTFDGGKKDLVGQVEPSFVAKGVQASALTVPAPHKFRWSSDYINLGSKPELFGFSPQSTMETAWANNWYLSMGMRLQKGTTVTGIRFLAHPCNNIKMAPSAWFLRSSVDRFEKNLAAGTLQGQEETVEVALSEMQVAAEGQEITFRLYWYKPGDDSEAGYLTLRELSIQGNVTP